MLKKRTMQAYERERERERGERGGCIQCRCTLVLVLRRFH